jgi:serine/threonine protein kinase
MNNRAAFIDFVQGLLNMDPIQRWSPQQARLHPFITGEKWTKPWQVSSNFLINLVSSSIFIFHFYSLLGTVNLRRHQQ